METITYLNIKVEGVPYTKILSLHIQNALAAMCLIYPSQSLWKLEKQSERMTGRLPKIGKKRE